MLFKVVELSMYLKIYQSRLMQKKLKNKIHKTSKIGILSTVFHSSMGEYTSISSFSSLLGCELGDYSYINRYVSITFTRIGKFVSIAPNVSIGLPEHNMVVSTHPFYHDKTLGGFTVKHRYYDKDDITVIGNDVWIGTHSVILKGVKIGDGAIIGAGSIVTKDVPPYSIVVGNPAKVLKYRFSPEVIEKLLTIKWWDFDRDTIEELIKQDVFRDINKFLEASKINNSSLE